VLLTHTPPYMTLDVTAGGNNAGCSRLAVRLQKLLNYRLHVFGHIHESHGAMSGAAGGLPDSSEERVSVNAALYRHALPVIVDLRN
jgi:hypothetical protein